MDALVLDSVRRQTRDKLTGVEDVFSRLLRIFTPCCILINFFVLFSFLLKRSPLIFGSVQERNV